MCRVAILKEGLEGVEDGILKGVVRGCAGWPS